MDQVISTIQGQAHASIDAATIPDISGGKDNPFVGHVIKRTLGQRVLLFTNTEGYGYGDLIRLRLQQQGLDPDSYIPGPRPWGVRLPGVPYVSHKDRLYLECIVVDHGIEEYRFSKDPILDPNSESEPIPKEAIVGLKVRLPKQGGLIEKVELKVYAFDSITALTLLENET